MKRVLITGGTSGIGLAAAECFLQEGAAVALVGRDKKRGLKAVEYLHSRVPGGTICFFPGDVSKVSACHELAKMAVRAMGGIDVLVNSAGIYFERSIEDMTEDDFDYMMGINLKGSYFMIQAVVRYMKEQKHGAIVNVNSDAGLHGNYLCSSYCASKGGISMLTKALALELAPWKIRVNSVCPGDVLTPMTDRQLEQFADRDEGLEQIASVYPLKEIGKASDIGAIIAFLASDRASFVTGALWSADGGITA